MGQSKTRHDHPGAKSAGIEFWHPLLHKRFGEELFFFLLVVKPFDWNKFSEQFNVLKKSYGISKCCVYQIYGEFDILVRIWLPGGAGSRFMDDADTYIQNLRAILPFHVVNARERWRFGTDLKDEAHERLMSLTKAEIEQVQKGSNPQLIDQLIQDQTLVPIPDFRQKKSIKLFIGLSPPSTPERRRREAIYQELLRMVENRKVYTQPTIYIGLGFAWIFLKIVVANYYEIGTLIQKIIEQFRSDGITTSTILVDTSRVIEGDSIGGRALETKIGDEKVRLFLPDLYSTSKIPDEMRNEIEHFVKVNLLQKVTIGDKDLVSIQSFLRAVLRNDVISAFTALFPRVIEAEQLLREELMRHAAAFPKGAEGLLQAVDPQKREVKSFNTMALGHVLRAVLLFFKTSSTNETAPALNLHQLENIAALRNKVMHGGQLELSTEWKSTLNTYLELIRVRDLFLSSFLRKVEERRKYEIKDSGEKATQ